MGAEHAAVLQHRWVWDAKAQQLIHQPADGFSATFTIKSDTLESSCLPPVLASQFISLHRHLLAALLGLKLCATPAH